MVTAVRCTCTEYGDCQLCRPVDPATFTRPRTIEGLALLQGIYGDDERGKRIRRSVRKLAQRCDTDEVTALRAFAACLYDLDAPTVDS